MSKVICSLIPYCNRQNRCGGAIPHDKSGCDPCPVHPRAECIPIHEYILAGVKELKEASEWDEKYDKDPMPDFWLQRVKRAMENLDKRMLHIKRTYHNFGNQP